MTTHTGDWSRVQNHDAARETWERVWGKKTIPSTFRLDAFTKAGKITAKAIVTQDQMDAMNRRGDIEGEKLKSKIQSKFDEFRRTDPHSKVSIYVGDPKTTDFLAGQNVFY